MTIGELLNERARAWEAAKNFLDEHPQMSGEDIETYNKMEADIQSLTDSIERQQKLEDMSKAVNEAVKAPVAQKSEKDNGFWNYVRTGAKNTTYTQTEGTNADGGYAVPKGFNDKVIEVINDENAIRPIADVITTSTYSTDIPVVSAHGAADWAAEAGAYNNSNETFSVCTLAAYKATRLIRVSEELLADAGFNLEAYLAKAAGVSIGALEEAAFVLGNGSGKPTGFMGTATSAFTSADDDTITADEVMDLFFSVKAGYRKNGTWCMKNATLGYVRKLKDGQGQYLWVPAMTVGAPDLLLGRPVVCSENMEGIAATKKPIAFGDFSYYKIGQRGPLQIKRLNERFADTGEIGFAISERVDGKLALAEAIKYITMHA